MTCMDFFYFNDCLPQLAISPQQRGTEPILIQNGSHLAVKVEGIIQHNSKPGIFREVAQIQLTVSSVLQARAATNIDAKVSCCNYHVNLFAFGLIIFQCVLQVSADTTNNMKQVVMPHNEYFSAQFLIAFPVAGLHTVTITTSLIDQKSNLWNTGPQSTLSVKSFEDPSVANKPSQPSTSHRQNFPHRF